MKDSKQDVFRQAINVEAQAKQFGFTWDHYQQVFDQVFSECREVEQLLQHPENDSRLQEEVGDLILATISLSMYLNIDAQKALKVAADKFADRLAAVESLAAQAGYSSLEGCSTQVKMNLWHQAKDLVG